MHGYSWAWGVAGISLVVIGIAYGLVYAVVARGKAKRRAVGIVLLGALSASLVVGGGILGAAVVWRACRSAQAAIVAGEASELVFKEMESARTQSRILVAGGIILGSGAAIGTVFAAKRMRSSGSSGDTHL